MVRIEERSNPPMETTERTLTGSYAPGWWSAAYA